MNAVCKGSKSSAIVRSPPPHSTKIFQKTIRVKGNGVCFPTHRQEWNAADLETTLQLGTYSHPITSNNNEIAKAEQEVLTSVKSI